MHSLRIDIKNGEINYRCIIDKAAGIVSADKDIFDSKVSEWNCADIVDYFTEENNHNMSLTIYSHQVLIKTIIEKDYVDTINRFSLYAPYVCNLDGIHSSKSIRYRIPLVEQELLDINVGGINSSHNIVGLSKSFVFSTDSNNLMEYSSYDYFDNNRIDTDEDVLTITANVYSEVLDNRLLKIVEDVHEENVYDKSITRLSVRQDTVSLTYEILELNLGDN